MFVKVEISMFAKLGSLKFKKLKVQFQIANTTSLELRNVSQLMLLIRIPRIESLSKFLGKQRKADY